MKKRFSEEQTIRVLKQAESGIKIKDLCREHGIAQGTFHVWKAKFFRHGLKIRGPSGTNHRVAGNGIAVIATLRNSSSWRARRRHQLQCVEYFLCLGRWHSRVSKHRKPLLLGLIAEGQ